MNSLLLDSTGKLQINLGGKNKFKDQELTQHKKRLRMSRGTPCARRKTLKFVFLAARLGRVRVIRRRSRRQMRTSLRSEQLSAWSHGDA